MKTKKQPVKSAAKKKPIKSIDIDRYKKLAEDAKNSHSAICIYVEELPESTKKDIAIKVISGIGGMRDHLVQALMELMDKEETFKEILSEAVLRSALDLRIS